METRDFGMPNMSPFLHAMYFLSGHKLQFATSDSKTIQNVDLKCSCSKKGLQHWELDRILKTST